MIFSIMKYFLVCLLLNLRVSCSSLDAARSKHIERPMVGFYSNSIRNRSIVIDSRWFCDPPGGVEAMIQLSIAAVQATSKETVFVSGYNGLHYHEKWKNIYGDKLVTQVLELNQLKKGDIIIFNEGILCPKVPEGVLVFIYLLANYRGCKDDTYHYLSHNHYLLKFENLMLPKERMIHPYLTEAITTLAHQQGLQHDGSLLYSKMAYRSKKTDLILVDDDVPESVKRIIASVAEALGGKALVLSGLTRDQLMDAYLAAKVATDWCMRGSERCMLEASLFGAVIMTNNCETGSDFHDLPIPGRFVYNHTDDTRKSSDKTNEDLFNENLPVYKKLKADITAVVTHAFHNYWELLDDFEPLRRSVISHTPAAMLRETVRFLSTVDTHEEDKLMKKKCVGC